MAKTTEELLNKIKVCSNMEKFVSENGEAYLTTTTVEYLNKLLEVKDLKIAAIAADSGQGITYTKFLPAAAPQAATY